MRADASQKKRAFEACAKMAECEDLKAKGKHDNFIFKMSSFHVEPQFYKESSSL